MECGNKGFALIPARPPDEPTVSFLFNKVFCHGGILSACQNARDVKLLLPELCQIDKRDDFQGVMSEFGSNAGDICEPFSGRH